MFGLIKCFDLLKYDKSALITTNTESTSWPHRLKLWVENTTNRSQTIIKTPIIEKLAVWLGNKE